jgi:Rhodopirellula transposase DDE domain
LSENIGGRLRAIVEPASQADPKFQTPLAYTRITAAAVHQQLATIVAGTDRPLPAERTVYDILNRLGYRLRRVRKTAPQKNSPKRTPSSSTSRKFTPAPPPMLLADQ